MSERVLNQAVYSLIKGLEVRTDRRAKGGEGASASVVQGASAVQSASMGKSASISVRQGHKVRCIWWGVFCSFIFICMYR